MSVDTDAEIARLRMALQMIKGWKDSTLLADPDEPEVVQRAYERGANKAFNECASIAERVLDDE